MKLNRYLLAILLIVVTCLVPVMTYANSAEPPTLVIIMQNAPEDAAVFLDTGKALKALTKTEVAWESYYVFYNRDIDTGDDIKLVVSIDGSAYEQTVSTEHMAYNRVLTWDVAAQTVTEGKLLSRSILLVGMRVLLTLAIEGLVFYLFGFRRKKSWRIFLVMNLITQGLLNLSLNNDLPAVSNSLFWLLLMEVVIFTAETIAVLALVKEHGWFRRITFVLTANLLSLILGGLLIMALPV